MAELIKQHCFIILFQYMYMLINIFAIDIRLIYFKETNYKKTTDILEAVYVITICEIYNIYR